MLAIESALGPWLSVVENLVCYCGEEAKARTLDH